jgi:hypothetical protein
MNILNVKICYKLKKYMLMIELFCAKIRHISERSTKII